MIARSARIEEIRRLKYKGHIVSNSARIVADGIDELIVLRSADEVAWAERMLDAGARLVVTVSEEAAT